jgi:hypothetical protein
MLSKYDDGTWRNAVTPVLDAVKPPFIPEDVEVMTIVINYPPGDPGHPPHRTPGVRCSDT